MQEGNDTTSTQDLLRSVLGGFPEVGVSKNNVHEGIFAITTEFVVHEGGEEARSAVHDAPNILCLLLLIKLLSLDFVGGWCRQEPHDFCRHAEWPGDKDVPAEVQQGAQLLRHGIAKPSGDPLKLHSLALKVLRHIRCVIGTFVPQVHDHLLLSGLVIMLDVAFFVNASCNATDHLYSIQWSLPHLMGVRFLRRVLLLFLLLRRKHLDGLEKPVAHAVRHRVLLDRHHQLNEPNEASNKEEHGDIPTKAIPRLLDSLVHAWIVMAIDDNTSRVHRSGSEHQHEAKNGKSHHCNGEDRG
mmetsp:Transcript_5039/g.11589  ORF Transcript_5039/g.11589 Transcript_5039/m.11589 type:complete len:298 (-) Transcript_5039:1063-1956(-)